MLNIFVYLITYTKQVIFKTEDYERERKNIIQDLIGKPYSLFETIKMHDVVSKRIIVKDASANLKTYLNSLSVFNYAKIERRSGGIIIHVFNGNKDFKWVIPYYQLVIFKTNGSSIHAQGKFLHFKNDKMLKENKPFFDRLLKDKVKHDLKYYFYSS